MLQNRGYSALNGTFSIECHTKHDFLKTLINEKHTDFLTNTCTECSLSIQKSVRKVTLGASNFLEIKSPFYNKGDDIKFDSRVYC